MVYKFLHKRLLKRFNAVNIHISSEGEECHVLVIKNKNNALEIESSNFFVSLDSLLVEIDKSIPCIINFSGATVIEKNVTAEDGYLSKILFNKDVDEFYISERKLENQMLVSVTRRSNIDVFLKILAEKKIQVIDFNIGAFILDDLRQIDPDITTLNTKFYQYNFVSNVLSYHQDEFESKEVQVLTENVDSHFLLCFASFISFLIKDHSTKNYDRYAHSLEEDYVYRKSIKVLGYAGVLAVFTLMVISYLLSNFYGDKRIAIDASLKDHNALVNKRDEVKKGIDYKQKVIKSNALDNQFFMSQYIVDVLHKTPEEINISTFEISPLEEDGKNKNKITVNTDFIRVDGVTKMQYGLNRWIEILNDISWIHKIEIETFDSNSGEFNFTLKIFLE
ncbi:MAG: hypothetical protein ACSHW7_00540 [Patiriisocius sp.]|uniref:hypothetical protein n=1 Tax=Patiriisocius sp. TaxID=2822396 RepID=UPI003EF5D396